MLFRKTGIPKIRQALQTCRNEMHSVSSTRRPQLVRIRPRAYLVPGIDQRLLCLANPRIGAGRRRSARKGDIHGSIDSRCPNGLEESTESIDVKFWIGSRGCSPVGFALLPKRI